MPRVESTTDHSIEVEWDPPSDNGGGEILGYHVDKVSSDLLTFQLPVSLSLQVNLLFLLLSVELHLQ